jgi:hypothetical protein
MKKIKVLITNHFKLMILIISSWRQNPICFIYIQYIDIILFLLWSLEENINNQSLKSIETEPCAIQTSNLVSISEIIVHLTYLSWTKKLVQIYCVWFPLNALEYNFIWSCDKCINDMQQGFTFSLCTTVSYTNKTNPYDITKILWKVALNTK